MQQLVLAQKLMEERLLKLKKKNYNNSCKIASYFKNYLRRKTWKRIDASFRIHDLIITNDLRPFELTLHLLPQLFFYAILQPQLEGKQHYHLFIKIYYHAIPIHNHFFINLLLSTLHINIYIVESSVILKQGVYYY